MATRCNKGDWVEIHQVVLRPEERSKDVPPDTAKMPLEAWIKGRAQGEAELGQEISIETPAGRLATGTLTRLNPGYGHTYGPAVPELAPIAGELRTMLKGGRPRG